MVKDFITANDASNLVGDRECVLGLRGVIIQYLELEKQSHIFHVQLGVGPKSTNYTWECKRNEPSL